MSRFVFLAFVLFAAVLRAQTPGQGELDASPTLFAVMAAINAAGYDAELSSPANHPARAMVRNELAKKSIPSLAELKAFFAEHRQKNDALELSQYISFALVSSGPPDFSVKSRHVEIPPDVVPLQGFAPILSRFYREADIPGLWNRLQPAFDEAIARYHEPVARAVLEVNSYLRYVTSGARGARFQIYVDLLAAPHQVQTRSYKNDYYVVVTPSPEPQIEDVRHAYLHYLIDGLASRHADLIMRKRGLGDHAQRAPALAESYKSDFLLLATESLIKAVEARLEKKPAMVQEALAQGYILAPYFAEQLPAYEKQEQAMQFYFPELVKPMDLRREDERLSKVEFASEAPVRKVKAPPEKKPEPSGAQKTLEIAEELYGQRELEKAKEAYMRLLRETDERPLHASAYYGLARIAVLQKDPETAERLFQKTLESSPEAQVKAWTLVYLGRLSDARGDTEQASRHYQAALGVDGASEAARKAAAQGAQQSLKKQN